MSLQQLLIFILLAESVFCLITQNDSERCSEEQLEHFLKQQYLSSSDSGGGYHLIIKENLKFYSAAATSRERYFIDKDQMVQYEVELTEGIGMKPITTAFIQIDVGGCQQPVGWFDQLDPQWNVTQCILDKQVFLQVVTNPHQKIKISWTTSLNCVCTFRYGVDEDSFNAGIRMKRQSPSSSQSESAETPYLLFANADFIHQISLDGSRLRTIISEPKQYIYTMDYHSRLNQLFWIQSSDELIRSSIDGSQQVTHQLDQDTCLINGIAVDWINDKLYYHDFCFLRIGVLDLASNLQKILANDTLMYRYYTSYIHMVVDPTTRLLYWNSDRGIERMSMDGKNRTTIIDVDTYDTILSFTLDYQTQVLYWVLGNNKSRSLLIRCSNTQSDGATQQTIFQLQNIYYYRFFHLSGLSVYNEILFLSISWTRELYKIGTNGDALLLINSSMICIFQGSQLRVTNQPLAPNPCAITNGGCSHLCLLSAVDPRGYSCDCPQGMILGDNNSNCINQSGTTTSPLATQIGSCLVSGYSSCCVSGSCQGSSADCYCDTNCYLFKDCCSDVPSDCEEREFTEYIIITNKNYIHRIDIKESRSEYRLQTPVSGLKNVTSLDYHYRNKSLFWADTLNGSVFIWRSSLEDESAPLPLFDTGASPTQYVDIAVDWVSDKIYWTNTNQIMVYDLRSGYQGTVINTDTLLHQVLVDPNARTIYWSDIGSNPARIMKASMDGTGVGTVVLLNNTNTVNIFVFTLDYSQQMLYWMNSSGNCHHTNYLESSRIDGSGRSIAYDPSRHSRGCYYGYYRQTQAIDFFGGAIYSYSRRRDEIIKTEMNRELSITNFPYVDYYMCPSLYPGMKVITSERQRPGVNPCAINNGGCAHLCLLSNTDQRSYTCACHSGTQLDNNGHDCNGGIVIVTPAIQGSCSVAGFNSCCVSGRCKGEPPNCYCDRLCHVFKDCCPDANTLLYQMNKTSEPTVFYFTTRPHNITTNQSRSVEFQCSICSTLIPNFKWNFTRNGSREAEIVAASGTLSAGYFIIRRHRSQVLIIPRVQWRHEGVYTCIVSSGNDQIQAEANLNVLIPLSNMVITGSSSTPARLDTVTIECSITANPPARIMWMKMDTTSEIIQTLINTRQASIADQLTYTPSGPLSRSTLTINNVEASDNGNYICEASSGLSPPSVSASFSLCVIAQGSVILTPHNHQITQSGRAELNCSVCPTFTPMFTWNFTQKEAQETETVANRNHLLSYQYTVISRRKSQALIIEDAQWRHVGVYKCIADIDGMIIQAQTSLDVLIPLTNLSIREDNDNPRELDTVTIECDVIANPPANISWFKRTNESVRRSLTSNPKTSITYQLINSPTGPLSRSTLTINNVEASDNGNYICEASSGLSYPSLSATNFSLCVIAQGSVFVTPHYHQITQSERAELNCSVCPTLMPIFTWNFTQKEAQEIETVANRNQPLSSQYTIRSGEKSQTLIIDDAQWRHAGVYKCIADIDSMVIQVQASLDVLILLTNLSIRGDKDNPRELETVTIECDVIANPPANISWFKRTSERVRALTSNPKTSITHQLINSPTGPLSSSTLTVRNLVEIDSGYYICEARNNYSSSESVSFNFTVMTQNECIIDKLGRSPCQNHGVCIDHINNYTCHCNGSYTGVNCSEEVPSDEVQPPMISQPPYNTVTRLGDPIHLNCTAEGHPAPTHEWYKDGLLIPDEIESVLYIPEPSPEDRGNYTCKAINSEGETDQSNPAKLDISDVVQYQMKLNVSGSELDQIMESITTTAFPDSSASIFEVKLFSENVSSEEAVILITVRRHDINFEVSVVHRQLRAALLQILQNQDITISRFDGCNYTTTLFDIGANVTIEIEWPETNLGDTASVPCPCAEFAGSLAGRAYRYCSGTFSQGADWEAYDDSRCEARKSMTTRRLCAAALLLAEDPVGASEVAVEETSTPEDLTPAQVSVSITIVTNITNKVLNNSEIRQNYLQAIDNIQQAPAEVVLESQTQTSSSLRLLESLQNFLDKVEVEQDENSTSNSSNMIFAFETFALQVQQLDPEEYKGQVFSVNLGSLEEATKDNQTIEQENLVTSEPESATNLIPESDSDGSCNAIADTTASLQLPEDLLDSCNESDVNSNLVSANSQRLSYSVFKSDILFQNINQRQLNLSVRSIIVAARLKCADNVTLNMSVKSTFQIDRRMEEHSIGSACAMWDKGNLGDRFGAWSTDGCREVMREGNRRVCECSQLAHFGILFDLNPKAPISAEAALALSIITYIGLIISLLCLMVFLISYLSVKKLRTSIHGQILINLSLSLIGVYLFFLIGGLVTSVPALCGISSALLHYFLLVYFGWTAVEAVWLYLKLVKVFGVQSLTSKFTLKAGIPTWVVPMVMIILCAGAASKYYINPFYCRATEWPFWIGMIVPFILVTIFNWIMFVLIMASICSHTKGPITDKKEGSKIKIMKTNFTIAATLAVVFGLGWALGLVATSLPVKELTLTFQILFSLFVGAQGLLLFLLHGLRNQDIRKAWIQCFATIGRKSHLISVIPSTKTSSTGTESLRATRNTSGVSTLPRKKDEHQSTIENTYSKRPDLAMEMVPASKGDWGQSEGGQQQVSFVSGDEEHIYDDAY